MHDGTVIALKGTAEIDLPAGATFIFKSPGGDGWGTAQIPAIFISRRSDFI
jgi:N-methylhydantoinase B/oxoprolinase/acetone carboxylase alpha subunit